MGNWRTVNIFGTIAPEHVADARALLSDDEQFGPLSFVNSLCGLGEWINGSEIEAWGNLAERDYAISDVMAHLHRLRRVAPSLNVRIYCGGEYESRIVEAVVTLLDGCTFVGVPILLEYLKHHFESQEEV